LLSFERINLSDVDWHELAKSHDYSVCQSKPWMEFVTECQGAEPVVARVLERGTQIGWFTGMIIRKFGMPILGSPFPGWTTLYMGFNLPPDYPRLDAVRALPHFAFAGLGCIHLELMDRFITMVEAVSLGWQMRGLRNREIDLRQDEEAIWKQMSNSSARYCIRKSEKAGVTVEKATPGDPDFASDYYTQLIDVFAKQGLATTYQLDRVQALIRHLHPAGKLLALRARSAEGECLSTAIFPGDGPMAYFWGGASLRRFQKLNPNEPLVWHAIKYWRDRGAERFDFGGGGTYKKKYGGREIEVPWVRKSKWAVLENGRRAARWVVDALQRLKGRGRG